MSITPITRPEASPSRLIAAEVRATMARQGLSQRGLATRMGVTQSWLSTRISPTATVDMTVEEVARMAEALGVPAERFLVGWLPRLDSNQQPSGYVSRQARGPAEVVELDRRRVRRDTSGVVLRRNLRAV